uniref:Uncharacterized protein n=1 Tax=Knipowitschia caucasica TaxID=637954 RepID=A0AAV2KL10_KNICA
MSPVRPGVEQPKVGSPSAPFEETEYEREKEEREFQLKREIALKRNEAEAVTAREVAFKKIEADAALRMRQLELQSAGRSPVSSSPVCNLSGRASEACASLAVSDILDYDCVKGAILRSYETWPKAHSAYVSPAHVVGVLPVAARDQSPNDEVKSIMWSDSAGGKVCPMSVLTHAQSKRGRQSDVGNSVLAPDFAGVGAPSGGRTDDTKAKVYSEKPELITSVSPPTSQKAGRKFSLAGLVFSCGIPEPIKLLEEFLAEIRQFDPAGATVPVCVCWVALCPSHCSSEHSNLVLLALMSNPDQRRMRGALLTLDHTVRIQHRRGKDNVVAEA